MEGWLREDHLARFIVDVVEQLDLSEIEQIYNGRGSPAYPPKLRVALLFYGYATGVFSSRKLERASYELVPFIYIAGACTRITTALTVSASGFWCSWKSCLCGSC